MRMKKAREPNQWLNKQNQVYIYIISNIGSFGKNVYKIGMTRRLDPMDRVKELGDASVPFVFDVHAILYSKNAPALEKAIHKAFKSRRINLVNNRKEFFRISLADIKTVVKKVSPNIELIETPEARQYKETIAILARKKKKAKLTKTRNALPDAI